MEITLWNWHCTEMQWEWRHHQVIFKYIRRELQGGFGQRGKVGGSLLLGRKVRVWSALSGSPGWGCLMLEDPKHTLTPGYITDDPNASNAFYIIISGQFIWVIWGWDFQLHLGPSNYTFVSVLYLTAYLTAQKTMASFWALLSYHNGRSSLFAV